MAGLSGGQWRRTNGALSKASLMGNEVFVYCDSRRCFCTSAACTLVWDSYSWLLVNQEVLSFAFVSENIPSMGVFSSWRKTDGNTACVQKRETGLMRASAVNKGRRWGRDTSMQCWYSFQVTAFAFFIFSCRIIDQIQAWMCTLGESTQVTST